MTQTVRVAMAALGHIVVVDDEPDIRETLRDYLEMKGYRVSCADGGASLRALTERSEFDLAILDINMPGEDGLTLARFLKETTNAGIMFLTAAGETVDRIVGLEIGADDYMPKPFDLRELHARIKAILRRVNTQAGSVSNDVDGKINFGQCVLDMEAHTLQDPDGAPISITSMEYDLLKTFAQNPNKVLSRDRLLDLAHNRDWDPYDRSIDIRITRLRRKIEPDPSKPSIIKTVRGAGYIFSVNEK